MTENIDIEKRLYFKKLIEINKLENQNKRFHCDICGKKYWYNKVNYHNQTQYHIEAYNKYIKDDKIKKDLDRNDFIVIIDT